MSFTIKSTKKISLLLVLTLLFSTFVPAVAEAGILSKLLSAVSPATGIIGNIAGAIAGATLCAGVIPPLGMLAGAVGGYIVGGIVGNYVGGGLTNIATLGGAALGVMACASMGPVGYIVGALAGGFLGKTAMKLLYKLDKKTTGGLLLSPASPAASPTGEALLLNASAEEQKVVSDTTNKVISPNELTVEEQAIDKSLNDEENAIQAASEAYQEAYKNYIVTVRTGNAEEIKAAHAEYKAAAANYKAVTGKEPK